MTRAALRAAARRILRAGLAAVDPARLVRAHLRANGPFIHAGGVSLKDAARVFVVSVGKAAVKMARAAHQILGERVTAAIVIAPEKAPRMRRTESFVSGHPIPDAAGVRAGRRVIRLIETAEQDDVVLLLLSGGASALMPAPLKGVSLREKQHVTRFLLRRGAAISEINAVRKRLSRLKGGGFARLAAPSRVIALALSDVPSGDIGAIGSGPAVHDATANAVARRTIFKFLRPSEVPAGVRNALNRPSRGRHLENATTVVIGGGRTFADAARSEARALRFRAKILEGVLEGEARVCGPQLVQTFAAQRSRGRRCLIATGETVVKVRGNGQGGRNQELALSAVPALARAGRPMIFVAFATDGKDGPSPASGGVVDDLTQKLAISRGVCIEAALDRNDSTGALRRLGGLLVSGPTGTNVADVSLILA